MNNQDINQHIHAEERDNWNDTRTKVENHLNKLQADGKKSDIHVPPLPSSAQYYLGGDLKWHQVPTASLNPKA